MMHRTRLLHCSRIAVLSAALGLLVGCSASSSAVSWETPGLNRSVTVQSHEVDPNSDFTAFDFTNTTGEHLSLKYRIDGTSTPSDESERWFRITIPPHDTTRVQHRMRSTGPARVIVRQG